jgi:nucleotide-binding universal stress UspA family protein
VIAERAEAGTFDLLVMGAYGHSRMRSLIIGSASARTEISQTYVAICPIRI